MTKLTTTTIIILLSITIFFACKKEENAITEPEKQDTVKIIPKTDTLIPKLPKLSTEFENFFNPLSLIDIHLTFSESEWNSFLHDFDKNNRNENYRNAGCQITGNGVNANFQSIGIRLRGNTSRKRPENGTGNHLATNTLNRVHFKLKFNHTFDKDEAVYGSPSVDIPVNSANKTQQLLTNVKALNLKYNKDDNSYIREAIAYELYRNMGVNAVHTTFARVYVKIGTEQERYLGVYLAFEDIDKTWIRKRNNEKDGTMFKCLWQDFGPADLSQNDFDGSLLSGRIGEEITDPVSNTAFMAGFKAYHPAYDLKEDPDKTGVDALNNFISVLNNYPTKEEFERVFDVKSFLRAMAVNVMIGMADDYWRGGNNYYLYKNPSQNYKWTYLPYDNDRSFGIQTFGANPATSSVLNWGDNSGTNCNPVLINKILAIPEYKSLYKKYLTTMIDSGYFTETKIINRIKEMQAVISPFTNGYNIGIDNYPFSSDLNTFSSFIRNRIEIVNKECRN